MTRLKSLKGQSLVEFALSVPLLLLLICGVFEFARMFQVWLILQNCAQAAARFATTGEKFVDPSLDQWDSIRLGAIKSEAKDKAVSLDINSSANASSAGYFHVYIYASDPPMVGTEYPGGPNARVAVDVIFNHPLITPLGQLLFPYITLTAHAEMVNERFRHPGYGTPAGVLPATIVPTPIPTNTPIPTATDIPTSLPTNTATRSAQTATITTLPTYTPIPTSTNPATATSIPTSTSTPSPTPTSCPIWCRSSWCCHP